MRAALPACAALLAAAAAAAGEAPRAVAPLIDKVLAAPADPAARAELEGAAGEAEAARKAAAARERRELMTAAARDKEVLDALRARKAKRLGAWEKEFSRVCALASAGITAGQAVAAYERLMDSAPVYSDNRELVRGAGEKIKGIFYATIRREFPYIVRGRARTDERDIAALLFTRASVHDENARYLDTGATQQILDMAARLRRREAELGRQYENLTAARELYAKRHYGPALELFEKVLAFDGGNEEAVFFRARLEEEAGLKH
ncbi:MAG: hypothetical protein ACYC2I_08225 [Elusimicrobiales bacterium]